jgi:deoxyribonuclease-4
MLIGAHVSPAGGPAKAVERGVERGCRSIQIFNQNPRAWKPHAYTPEQVEAYRTAVDGSGIDALLIHAVYLLNPASDQKTIREKSIASLTHALRMGDSIGADGVVIHPGSTLGEPHAEAIARAGEVIAEALAESDDCPLHLEDTAGAGGTLGRSFEELAALLEAAGGDDRLGVCLDSCHLLASGFDVRTIEGVDDVIARFDEIVGLDRLGSLHLNDSQTPLGSNRDRHANVPDGELGEEGCAAFLSAPAFDGLPCVLETPAESGSGGPGREEVETAIALRERGLKARGRAGRKRRGAAGTKTGGARRKAGGARTKRS